MPRYFFNVQDGEVIIDDTGTELRDATEARTQAVIAAGEALKDHGAKFWKTGNWQMNVVDGIGNTVCSLRFSSQHPV